MSSSGSSSSKPVSCDGSFVVIGAGLPRTGTNSMQKALERLLGGPCYHMVTVMGGRGSLHVDFWDRAIKRHVDRKVCGTL